MKRTYASDDNEIADLGSYGEGCCDHEKAQKEDGGNGKIYE